MNPRPTARHTCRRALALTALVAAGALTAGCSAASSPTPAPTGSTGGGAGSSATLTVFAAASLKESFTSIANDFETAHPGVTVTLNFGPSSGLASQILAGAPADVFASASQKNMDQVTTSGAATAPVVFATNAMAIALPPTNPGHITALTDLARADIKVAVCQSAVPCGVGAAQVFTKAKINVTPVTQEADVKAVLTKVQLGEVDAGIVYVTDLTAAGDKVKGLDIATDLNYSTAYPIATLTKAANPSLAADFVAAVTSASGRKVLQAAGFAAP